MLDIILGLINARKDKPVQIIPGYSNKPQPKKPFATAYLINHKAPDEYMYTSEKKTDDNVTESMEYWGEFTIQFDVLGNTEKETFQKARVLRELITYTMRYQDWIPNSMGIIDEDYTLKAMHEKADTGEYLYRYSFDITFESKLTMERITELAKTIDLTLNDEKIVIINRRKK